MKPSRNFWRLAGLAGGVLLLAVGHKNRHLFLVHDVTSGESQDYPYLRSRVYYADAAAVLAAAERAVHVIPGWKLVKTDAANLALDAEAPGGWGLPPDQVTVYVVSCGKNQSRAIVRSRAQGHVGDFGRNAAHIRALQDAMDRRLTQEAAI